MRTRHCTVCGSFLGAGGGVFRAYMVYLVRIQVHANIIGVYAKVCTVVPNPAG